MRVLVFGGTGMLGSQLVKQLRNHGTEVCVASRTRPADESARWHPCDVADREAVLSTVQSVQPQVIAHFAAALQFACDTDPDLALRVNVCGTHHVLEGATLFRCRRVVFASSLAAYGESSGVLRESMAPASSTSLYGRAKWFEEQLGCVQSQRGGFEFVALRFSGIFGPGAPGGPGMASVRKAIERTCTGENVNVPEASGDERAQLTHVDDAVAATLAVIQANHLAHSLYNVAGPSENYVSLREYHEAVVRLFPAAGRVHFGGRARSAGSLSTDRIAEDLGFVPCVTIDDGLRRTLGLASG